MSLAYLDAFFAVCETLSFSQAARRLSLTQPAISRQIRLLEEGLGQALFVRDRQSVALTPAGRALREGTLPAYGALLAGLGRAADEGKALEGVIRVGSLHEAGPVVELAIAFQKKHPGVVIQLELLDNHQIISGLHAGLLDLGIVTRGEDSDLLQTHLLYTQESVLVARAKNERDLLDHEEGETIPFVRYRFRSALHQDTESFVGAFIKKYKRELGKRRTSFVFAVNSHRAMAEVVAENDFYAVMPHYFVQKFLRHHRLRRVGGYAVHKKIFLTHVASPHFPARCKRFKSYVIDALKRQGA